MGYRSIRIAVNDLPKTIYLDPEVYELDAAKVLSLDFATFIPKLRESINHTFMEQYPVIEGVFRKQVVENKKYVFMGECSLAIRNSRRFFSDPKVSVLQSAVTVNEANLAGHGLKIKQSLNSNLLLYPHVYIFDEQFSDSMRWKFEGAKLMNYGHFEVYVLSYDFFVIGRLKERGSVYVRADNYAIVRLDREMSMPNQVVRGLEMKTDRILATYQFRQSTDTGKYLLHYSRLEWCFSLCGKGTSGEYVMTTDFLVTNIESCRKSSRIQTRADIDPFELGKNVQIVEKSDLRVIPPDYE